MKRNIITIYIAVFVFIFSCSREDKIFISPSDKNIEYMGRINFTDPEYAELYWSGTSVTINFQGTEIKALLKDERGENYYNVIIDTDSIYRFRPDTSVKTYVLAENLKDTIHTVQLFKRTEYDRGKTCFYGFETNSKTIILPKKQRAKHIEFYGNSVTAGYAVEDTTEMDRPDSIYTNNYNSYAALTARYFDADYTCICKSGIGIIISWFPYVISDIYNQLEPLNSKSLWDFSKKIPDVVVINLFQNDSWLIHMPEREEFKNKFGTTPPDEEYIIASYKGFLKSIREVYPTTPVICALGSMDITREGSPWPGYVEKAVESMDDRTIYTHFFPYKNTPGHPRVEEQKIMAESLIKFIEEKFNW